MSGPSHIYKPNLALLTDLYQLTMAYGYWAGEERDTEAVFHVFFREHPFQGGYTIAAGLSYVLDIMEHFAFGAEDVAYLASLTGNDGERLFPVQFLEYLQQLEFTCDVDAVPEGTIVFPHEPLLRIKGSIIECQLLETIVLNALNFQTLVATKAARVVHAAGGEPVLEFGLRRAQGLDGGLSASRAAYLGGVAATSNVLAGRLFGIPVKGTHAHSWVMCFEDEQTAFERYAAAMPNNCIFLVDTYDTVEGVKRAIEVGERLRARGHEMAGVRLDSGDLAYLSVRARALLDEAGFPDAVVVASNSLDEYVIEALKNQGATIAVWGVGTKLSTAYEQAALGGVYKLAAVRRAGEGEWADRVKLSEQAIKVSNPGLQRVRRYYDASEYVGDLIYDERREPPERPVMIDPMDMTRRKRLGANLSHHELLVPIFRDGARVYDDPGVEAARRRVPEQLAMFHDGIKRFVHPHKYPVGLEHTLHARKTELILAARGFHDGEDP
ncbi:MAG: nicotinate phosphoribosyltransferase [Myxococcota bacterium]